MKNRISKDLFVVALILALIHGVAIAYFSTTLINAFSAETPSLIFTIHETLYEKVEYIASFFVGVTFFIASIGLFTLKSFFYKLFILTLFVDLISNVSHFGFSIYQGHISSKLNGIFVLDVLFFVLLLWFFLRPRIKLQYT